MIAAVNQSCRSQKGRKPLLSNTNTGPFKILLLLFPKWLQQWRWNDWFLCLCVCTKAHTLLPGTFAPHWGCLEMQICSLKIRKKDGTEREREREPKQTGYHWMTEAERMFWSRLGKDKHLLNCRQDSYLWPRPECFNHRSLKQLYLAKYERLGYYSCSLIRASISMLALIWTGIIHHEEIKCATELVASLKC